LFNFGDGVGFFRGIKLQLIAFASDF